MAISDLVSRSVERVMNSERALDWRLADISAEVRETYRRVAPYTMTSPERITAVCDAVDYITKAGIPGDYVECGVWRGGSSMAAALTLIRNGDTGRTLHLYDTFEGMSAPTEHDRRWNDKAGAEALLGDQATAEKILCKASYEEVTANMVATGYPMDRVQLVRGKVEDTLPTNAPARIALLRLDTDWYESTRHELTHLYPLLAPGGVLIIDDYGYWEGARKAVDEYFADRPILLARTDGTGRMAVKMPGGGASA